MNNNEKIIVMYNYLIYILKLIIAKNHDQDIDILTFVNESNWHCALSHSLSVFMPRWVCRWIFNAFMCIQVPSLSHILTYTIVYRYNIHWYELHRAYTLHDTVSEHTFTIYKIYICIHVCILLYRTYIYIHCILGIYVEGK